MKSRLERWVEQCIGRHLVVDRSVKGGRTVIEVIDNEGGRWFAKQVDREFDWIVETSAYENLRGALGGRIPTLRAADADLLTLLISAVAGVHPSPYDLAANRKAGRVLRMIHESQPGKPGAVPLGQRTSQRLAAILARNPPGLFSEEEKAFIWERTRKMARVAHPPEVPCHGDYMSYNWLVGQAGTLRVIDFGHARWHVPAFDLTRLYFGPWWNRPHLALAFLRGYGRTLDRDELQFIRLHLVTNAVNRVCDGHARRATDQESFGRERLRQLMTGQTISMPGLPRGQSESPIRAEDSLRS